MQEPPKNIEEFLKFQNWDYWPREIGFKDNYIWVETLKKIKEDSSYASIYTHFWENVPRIFDALVTMESRLEECSTLLENHASRIFEWGNVISGRGSQEKLERYKAFLKKHHKKKMIRLSDKMETKKNIEGCNFSGLKTNELTQLPRHLDAEQIYLFILKTYNFDEKVLKIWKTHFLSEASIALLHDSFWWWFLHKFKPDKENQDSLFDRISESYVTLFLSIPLSRKDAFFQVYPDCLAQAIYATFQEAFPESRHLFNDNFKEDLGNNIFLWLSGLKPQRGFWTHWKLKELSTTTIHGTKKAPLNPIQDRIARSQERILNSIDFNVMEILKNPRASTIFTPKKESRLTRLTTKSHYASTGPEFNRVLFNIGSQSPLILYYLQMHNPASISKGHRETKIKLTEILQEPLEFLNNTAKNNELYDDDSASQDEVCASTAPRYQAPAPTYHDIIKEAKRQFARNQKDFRIEKHRIHEEIKLLRQRQERIDKELDRLQAKATLKPYEAEEDFQKFLHNLRCEAHMEREFLASVSSSKTTTEGYNPGEEEH